MKIYILTLLLVLLLTTITLPQIGGYTLDFDGANGYVSIPDNNSIDLNGTSFTLEAWVFADNLTAANTGRAVLSKWADGSGNESYFLRINPDGSVHFDLLNTNAGVVTTGGWYHIAAVYDNVGASHKLYVNGTEIALSGTPLTVTNNTEPLKIGFHNTFSNHWDGKIDEVRIWNVVRTEAEIKANLYKPLSGSETGLVSYYTMSNGSGTSLTDNKGSNSGTINGGAVWKASGCFAGSRQALDFDGVNEYVAFTTGNSPAYNNSTLTIEAWINSTSINTEEEIVNWGTTGTTNVVEFRMSEGKLQFGMDVGGWSSVAGTTSINTGQWVHVALTKNGNSVSLYVNGKLDATGTISATPSVNQMTIANVFQNGSYQSNRYEFPGKIDEVRIWSIVRTISQIRESMMSTLAGNESGLTAYYRFDYYDGDVLFDNTGNGKNGTRINMESGDWVPSQAFNTWIGGESSHWYTSANWSMSLVPSQTINTGLYKWDGGNEATISLTVIEGPSSPRCLNLYFSANATPQMSSNIGVDGNLLLGKDLDLNGNQITLGSSGYLVEGDFRLYGSSGSITTTRTLGTLSSSTNVAGLGFGIKSTGDLGSTTITRGVVSQTSAYLTNGVSRYYDVTAAGGGPYDIVFNYLDTEVPGSESNLALFKSGDEGATWEKQTATLDANLNTLSITGVGSMSRWTAADNNSPLPAELVSFIANVTGSEVMLNWQTSTEVNNYGFEIERNSIVEEGGWEKIGFVPGAGNSNSPKDYSFIDNLNHSVIQPYNHSLLYRLKQIDNDGTIKYSKAVEVELEDIPTSFDLSQNYPNPFNPGTTIRFALPADTRVTLEVFNIIGEKVATLINKELNAGYHQVEFDGKELSSGIYFYTLSSAGFKETRKMFLLK